MPTLTMIRERMKVIPVTITIVLFTFPMYLVAMFMPDTVYWLGLATWETLKPSRVHTFLTYVLVPGQLWAWFVASATLLVSGSIIEPAMSRTRMWLLILGSVVATSVMFQFLATDKSILVGSASISWGYCGAASVLGIARWPRLHWLGRLFLILLGNGLIAFGIAGLLWTLTPLEVSEVFSGLLGLMLATQLVVSQSRERHNNRLKLPARGRPVAE